MRMAHRQFVAQATVLVMALAWLLSGCSGSGTTSRPSASVPTSTLAAAATSTPALSQLSVYLVSAGEMYAVRADSGIIRWHAEVDRAEAHGPAVSGGLVYAVGTQLVALHTADGSIAWRQPAPYFTPNVIASAGKLYLMAPLGDVDAYNASNGQHLWHKAHSICWLGASMAADETALYLVPQRDPRQGSGSTCDTQAMAFRPSDGTPLWQAQVGSGDGDASLSVVDGLLYVNEVAQVFAVHTTDGRVLWQHQAGATDYGWYPVIARNVVYAATARALYALRKSDGSELWHLNSPISDVPVADDQALYVVEQGGVLRVLNPADGQPLWEFQRGSGMTTPSVRNGVVFVNVEECPPAPSGACGGPFTLYALQSSSGTLIWSTRTTSSSRSVVIAP
jgi:outer membrane protein assembly factor BamB